MADGGFIGAPARRSPLFYAAGEGLTPIVHILLEQEIVPNLAETGAPRGPRPFRLLCR